MSNETRSLNKSDVSTLVSLVGRQAAIKALEHSDVKVNYLRELAADLGIKGVAKTPKKEIAERIVHRVDCRIRKSMEELQMLDRGAIKDYLDGVNCDGGDIRDFLERANVPVHARMSRSALISFAAIQIESLGMFQRLSKPQSSLPTRLIANHPSQPTASSA